MEDVLLKYDSVSMHVADQPAEERDVAAGADRDVLVGHRARAREARVDVDDLRAALLRLHHPAEADRVRLGHRRALDQDAVGVLQVLLESVAPPRPNEVPRPGTVVECHMRAWFSICTAPIAVKGFLIR